MSAPERIYADRGPKGGWMFREERMPDTMAEYVRADLLATSQRELAEAMAERDEAKRGNRYAQLERMALDRLEIAEAALAERTKERDENRDMRMRLFAEFAEYRQAAEARATASERQVEAMAGALAAIRETYSGATGRRLPIIEQIDELARAALQKGNPDA